MENRPTEALISAGCRLKIVTPNHAIPPFLGIPPGKTLSKDSMAWRLSRNTKARWEIGVSTPGLTTNAKGAHRG